MKEVEVLKRANIAERIFSKMIAAESSYYDLREKLVVAMYENEKLKDENSKIMVTLDKAYDYMKQFTTNGSTFLEWFLDSIGQAVDKFKDGFRRKE